ncbi:MAG: aminopeptidase P family protein [Bdellovibrionales bacterium]|nr:aminopeptidase P family protein [Bdellovibrionales bacterium]
MRKPIYDMGIFQARRKILGQKTKGSAVIVASNPELIRNNDVHYPYRQDSNFFYLTGFEEPNSVLVFRAGQTPETVLFVQPKNPSMETWTGFRYGVDGAKNNFQIDATYSTDQLETELPKLLMDIDKVYYSLFINREFDKTLLKITEELALKKSRSNKGNFTIEDTRVLLGEMRLKKSAFEIEQIKKACEISCEAHIDVMKAIRPGMNERALHGVFIKGIMERGCNREGYGSILATGSNATTLHYVYNDQVCRDGELLLIDAGGEFNYFTADITRVYPVNGKFNDTQKRVYQKMLTLQKDLVAQVKPGQTREGLQKMAISALTDILLDEKLLKGKREELIEKKEYFKFYPHGIGHWLGLDVHDAGTTEVNGEPRHLEAGMVLTIEPGLYIPEDLPGIPEEYLGIGIRIEDDILVTDAGYENMTEKCPKEVSDLEAIIGKQA